MIWSRLRARWQFLATVGAVVALLVGPTQAIVASIPGPDPNFLHPLLPSACAADQGNNYEQSLYKAQGWRGPNYERYPGICTRMHFAVGPIPVRPGQNDVLLQPITYEKPAYDGYIVRFKPNLVRADGSVPPIEQIHLHHAVWFNLSGGAGAYQGSQSSATRLSADQLSSLDFRDYGSGPFFASGEEKTISDAPIGYGMPVNGTDQWDLLYMIHNQRAQPDTVWITYDIDYIAKAAGDAMGLKPIYPVWLDVRPSVYPVFNVQRDFAKQDPVSHRWFCTWPKDQTADINPFGDRETGQGKPGNGTGTPYTFPARGQPFGRTGAFTGGTLIGIGGHLHPGGVSVNVDLQRGAERQRIFTSKAHYWDWQHPDREGGPANSWDMSMSYTELPKWGVHVQPGDTVWMNATYDATIQATYEDMGIAIAFIAPDGPAGPTAPGVNPFTAHVDTSEGCASGGLLATPAQLCDKGSVTHGHMAEASHHGGPNGTLAAGIGPAVNQINITAFQYLPAGIPSVALGSKLTFNNLDAFGDIFHSITSCANPCTGATGIAFPLANATNGSGGAMDFDSGELGIEPRLGGEALGPAKNQISWTLPIDPAKGFKAGQVYTYFCRVHPFMRGAFAVTGPGGSGAGPPPAAGPPMAAGPAPPHAGGDWTSYGGDFANSRSQPAEHTIGVNNAGSLAPAWTFSSAAAGGSGDFTGTPVESDGYVFAGSNGGWVYALNADTGQLAWKTQLPGKNVGINSSLAVDHGRVFAALSAPRGSGANIGPSALSLDEKTGKVLWSTVLDTQPGSDVYASPVVYDGVVMVGVSGGSAELSGTPVRYPFHGSMNFLDAASGALLKKTWSIPQQDWGKGYAGAGIWSTPAVDTVHKVAFVGSGNPFKPGKHAPTSDAILKFDLDRTHSTFGQMMGFYDGTVDSYVSLENAPCLRGSGNPPPYYPQGLGSCGDIDLDFGAAPNLMQVGGRTLVGDGQKSGVYHVVDPMTMKKVWTNIVGPPSDVGGVVGSTAYDGYSVYGPITVGGYLWSLDARSGGWRWMAPIGDGAHYGNPVAVANGVVYTTDLTGFLDAYDARTGMPLMRRPMSLGSAIGTSPSLSWGGVSVARDTVYASVGISALSNGFIVAFRPGATESGGGGGGGGGLPPLPGLPSIAGPTVVAGPGAYATTYATPVMVMPRGGSLSFVNLDLQEHNVVSNSGRFGSNLVGLGGEGPVSGVGILPDGAYGFYCTIHPGMTGTLVVVG